MQGEAATAGGWSHCQPQAAGLGGKAPGKCFPSHTAVLMPQTDAPSRSGYITGRKVQMLERPKLMQGLVEVNGSLQNFFGRLP